MSPSKIAKRKVSIWIEKPLDDAVISDMQRSGLDYSKAFHNHMYKKDKKIEKLEAEIEHQREIFMPKNPNDEQGLPLTPMEKDAEPCKFYDVDRNEKPICRNPNPPLKTSHLSFKACKTCRELSKKQSDEIKKKEQEEVKRFHEQRKKNVHNLQKSVNETIEQEKTKETLCPHIGALVLLKKCEKCLEQTPYRYTACQQFKTENSKEILAH